MKKLLSIVMIAVLCLGLTSCLDDEEPIGQHGDPDQTWSVYWYLCGSDLESDGGAATIDLEELMEVSLPENVQFIIQTGGAAEWDNDFVDPEKCERYIYDSEGLELIEQIPLANMGSSDTLADFLSFCDENYPADKTMALFWNHGGGSVSGAAFDENYDYDSLTLGEFRKAFGKAFDLSAGEPAVDVVGFDACLMATIDTADTFEGIADFLVASAEMEPGDGWLYSDWAQTLGDDPGMDGAILGQTICDSYIEGCEWSGTEDEATLSVVDLGKLGPLMDSYEAMGKEALTYAAEDPAFLSDFSRQAESSENYGGNTRDLGYSNMVDLGHLAQNCEEILPEQSADVLSDLRECVIYSVNGAYHADGTGLACYHSFNSDKEDFKGYRKEGCSKAFKYLYEYIIEGELSEKGLEYVNSTGSEEETAPELPEVLDEDKVYPLTLDDEGYAVLKPGIKTTDMLKAVYFQLAYIDEESDTMIMLGQDNDIDADWEKGVFKDNFRGVWGAIDDYPVYMEISYEGDDYTAYYVPVLLNDEEYNLRVIYDYEDEEFHILGARKGLEDNGMADRNLRQLEPGDEITTILYAASISGDDDFEPVTADTFEVTEDTAFAETDMGDGEYIMMFELIDTQNNSAYSEMVQFIVDGENTDVEILEE